MLLNASVTVAYKCPVCGSFEFFDGISLSKIYYKKNNTFECRCGQSALAVSTEGSDGICITVPCISCECSHVFLISRKSLICNKVNTLLCPEKGIKLCFIGNDSDVRQKVDCFERELDEIINTFGYENYFSNTQVMMDSINHIHDIAEQGKLYCECGSEDIEISLLPDRIQLKCRACAAAKVLFAASNSNFKDIMSRNRIMLARVYPDIYDTNCKS
jgi:hypothetical protein